MRESACKFNIKGTKKRCYFQKEEQRFFISVWLNKSLEIALQLHFIKMIAKLNNTRGKAFCINEC